LDHLQIHEVFLMKLTSGRAAFLLAASMAVAAWTQAIAATTPARMLITSPVLESARVTLEGNTRPEVATSTDLGAVPDNFPLVGLTLVLKRPAEREAALSALIDALHNPRSPQFHQWLTAQQIGERFGLASADQAAIIGWLQSKGFSVNGIEGNGVFLDFSGTAGQVRSAFKTDIHVLSANGQQHFANISDPSIPAALASAVGGVAKLNNYMPHTLNVPRTQYTSGSSSFPYEVVPGDIATIYNFNPLFAAGISGQGQTIMVVEDTDLYTGTGDWLAFRKTFGLALKYRSATLTQLHPTGPTTCTDPGTNGDDAEAALDVEYASAAAPSAAIVMASCADTTQFGGFIAMQNLFNSNTSPAIISISYGESEASDGATENLYIYNLYQTGVAEGVSIFVSSGDEGAASSDANKTTATHGIAVSGFTSTPYNVSVGGTDFGDTYAGTASSYWSPTNGTYFNSALSYIPEIIWNDSCAGQLTANHYFQIGLTTNTLTYGSTGLCNNTTYTSLTTASGSGGPSGCATGTASTRSVVSGTCKGYPKPTWQSLVGVPSDGVRDIPDVSLFASNGWWGHYYVACWSDTANGGTSCAGAPSTWSGFGGTSISSPIMAGIQALVNQKTGSTWGNPNPTLYALAQTAYGASGNASCNSSLGNAIGASCVFNDVTLGDMDVPCSGSKGYNCYKPSGTYGVLSTSTTSYQPAYGTAVGWDFASGIGSVNAYNLVNSWPSP
jgi:subtilase family serine protease